MSIFFLTCHSPILRNSLLPLLGTRHSPQGVSLADARQVLCHLPNFPDMGMSTLIQFHFKLYKTVNVCFSLFSLQYEPVYILIPTYGNSLWEVITQIATVFANSEWGRLGSPLHRFVGASSKEHSFRTLYSIPSRKLNLFCKSPP